MPPRRTKPLTRAEMPVGPDYTVSAADALLIRQIVQRALTRLKGDVTKMTLILDYSAAHNGHPLRLADWLATDDLNFFHDAAGIVNHIDRRTGRLGGMFEPRFTLRSDTNDEAKIEG